MSKRNQIRQLEKKRNKLKKELHSAQARLNENKRYVESLREELRGIVHESAREFFERALASGDAEEIHRDLVSSIAPKGKMTPGQRETLRDALVAAANGANVRNDTPARWIASKLKGDYAPQEKELIEKAFAQEFGDLMIDHLFPEPIELKDKGGLWSDAELQRTGHALWRRTYRIGAPDEIVILEAHSAAVAWGEAAQEHGTIVNAQRIAVVEHIVAFATKWADHAFQRITTSHTFASALMCTDSDRSALEDIEMQWHAFMVQLPNGLFSYTDDAGAVHEYSRILVASYKDRASLILLNQDGRDTTKSRIIVQLAASLADALEVRNDEEVSPTVGDVMDGGALAQIARLMNLAKRLVAGLLFSMQHQNNFRAKTYGAHEKGEPRDEGPPAHRVVYVGRPLDVDCRPAVRDYIANGPKGRKNAPPSLQVLVRGHHRRQVIGVGRLGRKVIWIEPFWRGPKDAPILSHPFKVGT